MPANYVLLEKVTLTASAASVVFDNIPQTGYTDLKVVMSVRTDRATGSNATVSLQLNTTTTSVYSSRELGGNGSAPDTGFYSNVAPTALYVGRVCQATDTASTFGQVEVYIPKYSSSLAKSASCESVQENNAAAGFLQMTAWNCSDTAPINALTFTPNAGTNFVTNSEFALYGIAAVGATPVIAPFATGGDIVTSDGTYWIHTFLSSGIFAPSRTLSCDYLVVAGGGGGGTDIGGGGGAGGLRSTVTATGGGGSIESPINVTAANYLISVGAGGASDASGNNSVFSSITSTGGGRGGGNAGTGANGATGGSGGGSGGGSTGAIAGSGTINQGFAGSAGVNTGTSSYGGAGGGASAAATNVNGANGVTVAITGSSVTYAGGGGAGAYNNTNGTGGTGGGGAGQSYYGTAKTGLPATSNTGGGGGGGSAGGLAAPGGAGGSGIVIIRYPMV